MERRQYRCEYIGCNKVYTQKRKLTFHIKVQHNADQNNNIALLTTVTCSFCEKNFSSKSARQRHENVVHIGLTQINCDICSKAFSTLYALRGHTAAKHNDDLILQCSDCGKKFSYKHATGSLI